MLRISITAALTILHLAAFAVEPDPEEILDCAAANGPEKTFIQSSHIVTTHPDGSQRNLEARIRGARHDEQLGLNIHVENPNSMRGTVVLFKEREGQDMTRIFLPSIMRAQNVSGSMAATKLLGTDFSYLDVKQLYGSFLEGERQYLGKTQFSGREAHEISIKPSQEESSPYDLLVTYIDTETCVVLGVHFKSGEGNTLKRLEADAATITGTEDRHLVHKYTMHDVMNSSSTTVELGDIVFDEDIPKSVFHPQMFMGARQ